MVNQSLTCQWCKTEQRHVSCRWRNGQTPHPELSCPPDAYCTSAPSPEGWNGNENIEHGDVSHKEFADLVIFEPSEAVRTEDKPIFSRGALDERDRDTQPPLPDELVIGCSRPSLLPLGGAVKPNEVWVVGVHVGQLYLNHQLQLQREREGQCVCERGGQCGR